MDKTISDDTAIVDYGTLYLSFRQSIIETLTILDLPITDVDQYIRSEKLRNQIIKQEYNIERAKGTKAEYLYLVLAEKYSLSCCTIRAIVKERR